LRHEVIPQLEARWPQFGHSVLRSAALCAEQDALLDTLLAEKLSNLVTDNHQLDADALAQLSIPLQRALLRAWITTMATRLPSFAQLEQIRTQMLHTTNQAQPKVCWGAYQVTRDRQRLLTLTRYQP